jgi:hypothetical protein
MHYHFVEDDSGNVVDLIPFCSDLCHRAWCADHGSTYGGWNGCHEGGDSAEFCANCGDCCHEGGGSVEIGSKAMTQILPMQTYTDLGGYPLYAICHDAGVLCPKCANENGHEDQAMHDGWLVVAIDVNYEDPRLYCDHCNQRIESAYAEDDAENEE